MAETLKNLKPAKGATRRKARVGRGIPSGSGKTCGRGHRGQKCRSGYSATPWKEGGQTPLYRRVPKMQTNIRVNRKEFTIINLNDLQDLADSGMAEISLEALIENGIVKKAEKWGLKVLADGELTAKVSVAADRFSASAKEAIEKAGGTATIQSASAE